SIVIFGASGDLTRRKLIPALYELYRKERLPLPTRIVGFSRTPFTSEAWRENLAASTARFVGNNFDAELWRQFATAIEYQQGNIENAEDLPVLNARLNDLEGNEAATRVYYLSTAPQFYETTVANLGAAGMVHGLRGPTRVVIEKPFGTDLTSARALNMNIHRVFNEDQIYRIDHYLGKETVQNVLVFRFANAIFEPIWNRNYIDHVQITAAEELTVGHRAAFYDHIGVLRDMFQNHLLQLLCLTAMEAPARYEANAIRDEKVKVLRSVRSLRPEEVAAQTLRGQYLNYRNEPGVMKQSQTATFGVVQLHVDNWRWQGVPFFLRSGKAMSCPTTQIVIQFRQVPHLIFEGVPRSASEANRLVIQVQPAEGIQIQFQTKVPDAGMKLRSTDLSFRFAEHFAGAMPEAYQRLLLDVLQGDPSLFARSDEVELAWSIIDPIQQAWDSSIGPTLQFYETGAWGPTSTTEWMTRHGCEWYDFCPVIG
ncbi:MAG TPA: glucose-6-phosphate dehydrogenase, partial [Thermoguttaceae bacterium]